MFVMKMFEKEGVIMLHALLFFLRVPMQLISYRLRTYKTEGHIDSIIFNTVNLCSVSIYNFTRLTHTHILMSHIHQQGAILEHDKH